MKRITKEQALKTGGLVLPYVLAFVISLCIGLITYAAKEVMPFGENSVLCMDLWGQYFPMYVEKANADSFSELLYSWNGALGYNIFAQNAYYSNSIFLLLLEIVPLSKMVSAINWICLLKMGCSACTALGYLQYKLRSRSPYLIAAGVAYSACAYMLAFLSQPMWTDSLIYVPLILIGLERLVHEKKPLMYVIFLAACIISSFYIGFAVCIFLVLYFFVTAINHFAIKKNEEGKRRLTGFKAFAMSFLRFAGFSILGGGAAAAVILPIGYAVSNTVASTLDAPSKLEWYENITAYMQQLLPGRMLALEYDLANLYVGLPIFLLVPLYFCNKKFRLTERILHAGLVVFLFASMNCNLLDYAWHGFHFPNQLPGRWTFLLSLELVILAGSALARREGLTPIRTGIGLLAGYVALFTTLKGLGDTPSETLSGMHFLLLAAVTAALIANSIAAQLERDRVVPAPETAAEDETAENETAENEAAENEAAEENAAEENAADASAPEETSADEAADDAAETEAVPAETKPAKPKTITIPAPPARKKKMRIVAFCCVCLIAVLHVCDSAANFSAVAQREQYGMRVSSGKGYSENVVKMHAFGDQWAPDSDEFYRNEANGGFTFNPSMLGDFHGIGYYSSTMNGDVFKLLRFLGNRVYAQNVSTVYNNTSPVQNSLFGIRHILDFNKNYGNLLPNGVLIDENEKCNIFENPTALSVAYPVSDQVLSLEINDQVRAIQNQNTLLNSICGETVDVFERMNCGVFWYDNATMTESANWNTNYFHTVDGSKDVVFHYEFAMQQDGPVYLEHNYRAGKLTASWNGGQTNIDTGAQKFAYLGRFHAGDIISVDAVISGVGLGCCGLNMYYFNEEKWNSTFQKLSAHQMDVESFNQTSITGSITMDAEGLVMTSIPQDGGWEAYCDGQPLAIEEVGDSLIAVRVPEGTHVLKFRYHVPGLAPGLIISITCVLLAIIFGRPDLIRKLIRKVCVKRD